MPDADDQSPVVPDSVLLASVDVARTALLEITDAATVGAPAGHIVEGEHVLSLLFECTLPGYPGWHWTVTMSRVDDESEPSVLEAELMPGENALLAPEWVPWSERLADYQAQQEAARAAEGAGAEGGSAEDSDDDADEDDIDEDDADEDDADEDDADLDEDDLDEDDLDDLDDDDEADDIEVLHSGDIDGVDIDDDDIIDEDLDEDLAPFDGDVDEAEGPQNDSDDVGPQPPEPIVTDETAAEDER
jgi:AAA ATPase containing von Willebrand factor type A (vWA) domain